MTIARRRSLSIAVCIASASLLAAQPALADARVREAETTIEQQQESLTTLLKKFVQFLKDIQQQKSETTTTTIKRG